MKLARARVTDYRPGAGRKPALEAGRLTRGGSVGAMTGLEHLTENQAREAAEHDRWVASYPAEMLDAAYEDLRRRPAYDMKNPEHRWIAGRRAALARTAQRMVARGEA